MHVPALVHWPGKVKPGVTHELVSSLDILPTILTLANRADAPISHGMDATDVILGEGQVGENLPFLTTYLLNIYYAHFSIKISQHYF